LLLRYAAWGLVFVVPELFALLKVLWNTSFIKRTRRHQWPSATAIFVVSTQRPHPAAGMHEWASWKAEVVFDSKLPGT
jgi:hypothetical protein